MSEYGGLTTRDRDYTFAVGAITLVIGYAVLQEVGLRLAFPPSGVAAFWPAAGLAMALLERQPQRRWPLLVAGLMIVNAAGNIAHGVSWQMAVAFSCINASEATAGGLILRRAHDHLRDAVWLRTRWMLRGLLPAAVLPAALAAGIGALAITSLTPAAAAWPSLWWTWFSADLLGVIITVPATNAFIYTSWLRNWTAGRVAEAVSLCLVQAALLAVVFSPRAEDQRTWQWPFIVLPSLFWAVVRFGPEFTSCLNAVVTTSVVWGTATGNGPFAAANGIANRMVSAQAFCLVIFLSTVTIAHVLAGRAVAERALHEQYETLAHAVEGISFLDTDGRYRRVNRAYAHALRREPHELIGQTWEMTVHPEDRPIVANIYQQMLDHGKKSAQVRGLRSDGTVFFKEVTLLATRAADGTFAGNHCFMRDISERRDALDQIDQFFALSRDLLCVLGKDGYFRRINPAWTRIFGHSEEVLLSGPFTEFLHPDDVSKTSVEAEALFAGHRSAEFENRYRTVDGTYRWISWTATADPVNELIYGVARDITDLRETAESLSVARDKAIEASRLKSQFLATMSHEIRTPMNGVIGLADLLSRTELTPAQRRYADGIRRAGDNLLAVINDILDFSKIEAGKVVLESSVFSPATLISEVTNLMEQIAQRKDLTLITDHADLPAALRGDPGRIRQVMLNLIGNAIKFTDAGSVTVRAFGTHYRSDPDKLNLCLEVTDTGPGMTPKVLARIFDPFRQADATTTRTHGGTGLGLAICRQLIEHMGGTITAHSQPGTGSTFTVTIPLPVAAEAEAANTPDRKALHVLIVDDNETSRTTITDQLSSWGMRGDTAAGAAEALTKLRAASRNGKTYDLAIIDMYMPELNGYQLAEAVKTAPDIPDLPVILLTSGELPTPAEHKQNAVGIKAVLAKPVGLSSLFDALTHVTARRATNPTAGPSEPSQPTLGTVLLVEDNELNQLVAVDLLHEIGYKVDTATDGLDAIEKASQIQYGAILMDCQMPRMDGFTATEKIRETPRGANTPIIAMTADAFAENRERCLQAGMNDYLSKPVRTDQLQRILEQWISDDSIHR